MVTMRYIMRRRMRLEPGFRAGLYGVFALLFVTGAAWFVADRLKDLPDGEFWQAVAAALLMTHGGAAMIALMFLGALIPVHIRRWWRADRNRFTGGLMVVGNAVLIMTAFGLYYAGSETWRPWIGDIHLAVGLGLPVLVLAHVWMARLGATSAAGNVAADQSIALPNEAASSDQRPTRILTKSS